MSTGTHMMLFVPVAKKPRGEPIAPAMSGQNLHAILVYEIQTAMRHAAIGVLIQRGNHFFQKIRRHRVVARGDIHILSTCQFDAIIETA